MRRLKSLHPLITAGLVVCCSFLSPLQSFATESKEAPPSASPSTTTSSPSAQRLAKARQDLLEAWKKRGLKDSRAQEYLKDLEGVSKRYGTSEEQISQALEDLTALLDPSVKSPLYDDKQILQIVETTLHNLARPMEIDQGYHPTCNVTTVEVYGASRSPEQYSRLIKEIVTTGKYTTSGGSIVTPPKAALMPGDDEKTYDLDKANNDKRNIASQIVQMTLINGTYELGLVKRLQSVRQPDGTYKKEMVPQKDIRYILGPSRKKPIPNGYILLGEDLLVDKNNKPIIDPNTGDPADGPGFTQTEVLEASKLFMGKEMPYIKNPYKTSTYDPQTGVTTETPWIYDLPTKERLLQAKKDGLLPLGVPTIGGAHVQTIHDVHVDDKGQCWVLLDNQHGQERDGWVTLEELHQTQKNNSIHLKPKYPPNKKPWEK